MNDVLSAVRQLLIESGFEIGGEGGFFAFVAQNSSVLVFVAPAGADFELTINRVLSLLAVPFRTKRFGPKTMEMYCIFVSETKLPLSLVERCEQDIRVCRKVVVVNADEVDARLSFLRPLDDVLQGFTEVDDLFWTSLGRYLDPEERGFLRQIYGGSMPPEDAVRLIPGRR